jgi:fused signal recognition particle receptor
MFGFGRKHKEAAAPKVGFMDRLREGLARTSAVLNTDVTDLIRGRKRIDEDLLEELETLLLTADVGVEATNRIIESLSARVRRHELARPEALIGALREELLDILSASECPVRGPAPGRPQVILMVGVNGAGKTTTIGKLAKRLLDEGNSVMLAAGDTFRAAAVVFDALQSARAKQIDVLIADTAGRLHTKGNLMEELAKIARVMKKVDPDAPHEVMLVVDATTGQNAVNQAIQFNQAIPLTGITLTKLDGTAKGGVVFAVAERLKVPIRFVGVGERIEDLRPFQPEEFLDALFAGPGTR